MLALILFFLTLVLFGVLLLTGALCALCLGMYDEIYGDLENESGD